MSKALAVIVIAVVGVIVLSYLYQMWRYERELQHEKEQRRERLTEAIWMDDDPDTIDTAYLETEDDP